MWLLLNGTLAPVQIAVGTVVAVSIVFIFRAARPVQARLRRPQIAMRLLARVLLDILRSNIAVARIILGLVRDREVRSGFLDIPLDTARPAWPCGTGRHRHLDARHGLGRSFPRRQHTHAPRPRP